MAKCSVALSLALAISLMAGCGQTTQIVKTAQTPEVSSMREEESKKSVSTDQAALQLLACESAAHPEENVIVSPLSVAMALGMAYNGASGQAAEELCTLLGGDVEAVNAAFRSCLEREDGVLSVANSMWWNETLNGCVNERFKQAVAKAYRAEDGSFSVESEASAKEINHWVSEQTNGKIDAIITKDHLKQDTLALLVNALYFQGKWVEPFEEYQVNPGTFHAAGGEEEAEFLCETLGTYYETETAVGFSKPYENDYEFIGILSKEDEAPDLNALNLEAFLASQTEEFDVSIKIPKFELEYAASLNNTLSDMGLPSLFARHAMDGVLTEQAKASGVDAWVSEVLHKTYMRMYEGGTEAAAATAVIMMAGCAMPVEKETRQVWLDRPFAFLIRDTQSGQIVFCGVIHSLAG